MSCSNTSSTSRRVFIAQVMAGGTAVVTLGPHAQAAPMVDEKDAQASALGYVADTTKADAKKFPKHAKDQKCSNCQLYTGKAGDKSGAEKKDSAKPAEVKKPAADSAAAKPGAA